jgi:UDP-N-acetylmuramoyl-L-alanyl-D-glutamate--2,6-diaminopimelate ligase
VDAPGAKGALAIVGGTSPESLWRAKILKSDSSGTDIELHAPIAGARETTIVHRRRVRLPLVGGFNVMNALEALCVVHGLYGGMDEDAISLEILVQALERVAPPPGRLEGVTRDGDPIQVYVDYAHTDDALKTVLTTLRESMGKPARGHVDAPEMSGGRLICVFGCGGDRDATKRPRMGRVASELADEVIITSDNPRSEQPETIIQAILDGCLTERKGHVRILSDRREAIEAAVAMLHEGDVLIVAGKGHEDYQIVRDPSRPGQTKKLDFDDRLVAKAALQVRGIPVR